MLSRPRRLANWLRLRLWWFAAGGFLLLAIWVILLRQLLTMVPTWQDELAALIEAQIQAPVEIGRFSGHMSGLSPVFVLEDVHLLGADAANPGLALERVELTVDVLPSLLSGTLRARSLLVRGLHVRVLLDEDGRLRLHGIEAFASTEAGAAPAHEKLLQLLYRQKRIQVEQVSGTLEVAGAETVEITELNLAMLSSGQRHRLALTARSAADKILLDLRLDMRGDAYRREQVSGRGYIDLTLQDAEPWLQGRWPLDIRPEQINGKVQGWLTIRAGELKQSALRVRLDGLTLSGAPLAQPWQLTRLAADAVLDSAEHGYRLELARLVLADEEDRWQPGAMTLSWNVAGNKDWSVALHDVDVAPFSSLLQRLPWQDNELWQSINNQLDILQPSGTLRRLSLRGTDREVDMVSARFEQLAVAADGRRPGASGLSGWLSGDLSGGYGRLESNDLVLQLPALFERPLSAAAQGAFRWRDDGERFELNTGWLTVANADARGQALAGLTWRRQQTPELTLLAALADGRAANAAHYIPTKILPDAVAEWLEQAFVGGKVEEGLFLHEGPVKIDPARQQDRTFQMRYRSDNLSLNFLPEWPLVTDLSADVLIDGRHISARQTSARLLDSNVKSAAVDIPSWQDGDVPVLIISGQLDGPANSVGALLHDTPLAKLMPDEVLDWHVAQGRYQGHLLLHWPLGADHSDAVVRAQGQLNGVRLSSEKRRLRLDDLLAEFSFDLTKGLQLPRFSGQLFDRPLKGAVATAAGSTKVSWRGAADMATVRDWLDLPWLSPASGNFEYSGLLTLPWRHSAPVSLLVESSLDQVTVDLPKPFAKQAGQSAPLRLEWVDTERGSDLQLRYQNWLAARLQLEDGELEAGRIRFGGGAALRPQRKGLSLEGRLPLFELAAWGQQLPDAGASAAEIKWPTLDLQIDHLDLYGYGVAQAQLSGQQLTDSWLLTVAAPTLVGSVDIPNGYRWRGDQPMTLVVTQGALVRSPDTGAAGQINPAAMPTVDVQLDGLSLNEEDIGRWQFSLRPRTGGVALEQLDALWRNVAINGQVDWRVAEDGQQRSHFVGTLKSKNLARSLRRWKLDPFIESNDARAELDVSWLGDPTALDYLALQGSASVAIGAGRVPKTDSKTSALRVLGVFNASTVSRRLRLDFTDLYKKGLAFEEITGDFTVDGSVVSTSNLQIKSPSAEMRLRGEMDIAAETLDHYMEVTLPLSSNLYVGCLAGPAACAGIFVVERLWGERLEKMTSLGYRVTGTWDAPKVEEQHSGSERGRN